MRLSSRVALLLVVLAVAGCGGGGWTANEAASVPAGPPASLTLLVHLDGLSPVATGTTTVRLTDAFGYGNRRRVDVPPGETVARFDVTHLVRERGVVSVPVAVDRLDHVAEPAIFYFPAEEPASGVYETTVRMAPAFVVSGRVVDTDGQPRAFTLVGLYPLDANARRSRWLDPCATVETGDDGAYRLATHVPGPYLVVASQLDHSLTRDLRDASDGRSELLPDGVEVDVGAERVVVVRDLVLRHAVAIEGTLHVRGRPLSGLPAKACPVLPEDSLMLATEQWPSLVWTGERVVPYLESDTASEEDGAFCIDGLASGPHEVSFSVGYGYVVDPALEDAAPVRVDAPSRGAVVDVNAVVVHVRPRDASGRLENARVRVDTPEEALHQHVRPDRPVWFLLQPDVAYWVQVSAPGYGTTEVLLDVPSEVDATTLDVTLQPAATVDPRDCGSVRAHVQAGGAVLIDARVTLHGEDGKRIHLHQADEEPAYVATEVPAGAWVLRITPPGPDASIDQDLLPYALTTEVQVLVSPEHETKVEASCAFGGLLEIAVRDAHGRCIGTDVILRDERGAVVEAHFGARMPCSNPFVQTWTTCLDGLLPLVPSIVEHALPPGVYEIEVQVEGEAPRYRSAEILAGRVTQVAFE